MLALNALGSNMGADSNPSSPASHPAPSLWSGKAVEEGPKPWNPAPTWETWRSSWLLALTGAALAVVVTWGVNHRTEDLPPVSFPFCISDFVIEKNTSLKKKKTFVK